MWGWVRRLVEPTAAISDIAERRRARMLASIVLAMVPLGFVTVTIQLFTRTGFFPTFASNFIALTLLAGLGWLARTRHYRRAAGTAVGVIVLTCAAAGLNNPDDPVWWAYGVLAVLVATVLISIRGASVVALAALLSTVLVEYINGPNFEHMVAPVMFHVVVSPILLLMAHHRNLLEDDRRAQLAFNQDLLQMAQRVAKLAHWRWRPTDDVLEVPPALERLLGLPPGETTIETLVSRFEDEVGRERMREALGRVADHPLSLELPFTRADGAERYSVVTAATHETEGDQVVIGTVQDVTDRVLSEREKHVLQEHLHEAQRLETVGRIAGGIAHDFNNLLMVIMSSVTLARESRGKQDLGEILDEMESAGERGILLTRQLLAYARKQVLAPTSLDLAEVVTNMEPILTRLAGRDTLHVVHEDEAGTAVMADRSQIEQVILNLVVNASAALEGEGRIEIRTGSVDAGPPETPVEDQPCVYLVVSDDGSGMADELRARVFEPFFTTKSDSGGTGLGLATVHGIVHQSGGCIEVDSAPGEGTTFRMYLPQATRPAADAPAPERARSVHASRRVLVVDDELPVLRSVVRMLEGHGYDVIAAHGPAEARRLWIENRDTIDLVLSDVVMPVTDGVELVTEFLRDDPGLHVVLMSGFSATTIEKHGFHGMDIPLLRKPFSQDELLAKLELTPREPATTPKAAAR